MSPVQGWQPARTGLQQVRDFLLCIMALLVSVVCALILYLALATGSAIHELRTREPVPVPTFPGIDPLPTGKNGQPCLGEELPAGC
jgi:hypothetical protein